jgi:excisionase family DNA binding protein
MSADRLLTSAELADALGLHRNTVKKWQAAGTIPVAIREGNTHRFDLADVRKALAKRAAKAAKTSGAMPDKVLTF